MVCKYLLRCNPYVTYLEYCMCDIEEIACVKDIAFDKKYEPLAIDMVLVPVRVTVRFRQIFLYMGNPVL